MPKQDHAITFELSIKSKFDNAVTLDILKDVLIVQNVRLENIVEVNEYPFTHLCVYFSSKLKVDGLVKRLKQLGLKNLIFKIKKLEKKEWQAKWKAEFKPFQITKRFRIIPAWMKNKAKVAGGQEPIYLDTSFAFGSGMHPTTKMMVELIERSQKKFESFLDIGTGSGILSVIAVRCEAKRIKAIDLHQDTIKVAKENFKRNGIGALGLQAVDFYKFKSSERFDFVAANLITQDLIRMGEKIVSFVMPGKILALSGISVKNYPFFRKSFNERLLHCLKVERREGWVAILYKKTSN